MSCNQLLTVRCSYLSFQVCDENTDVGNHQFRHQSTDFWEEGGKGFDSWPLSGQLLTWLLTNLPEIKKKTKKQRQEFITQNKTSQTDSRNQAAYWILYTHKNCTDRMTSPMIALTPYSVLHTDTAWANTDDNCSKCWSIWITFTPAPVTV